MLLKSVFEYWELLTFLVDDDNNDDDSCHGDYQNSYHCYDSCHIVILGLRFLGCYAVFWNKVLEIKSVQASKSEIIFLEKIKDKVQMNKTVSFAEDEQKQFLLYKELFGSINHHQ